MSQGFVLVFNCEEGGRGEILQIPATRQQKSSHHRHHALNNSYLACYQKDTGECQIRRRLPAAQLVDGRLRVRCRLNETTVVPKEKRDIGGTLFISFSWLSKYRVSN